MLFGVASGQLGFVFGVVIMQDFLALSFFGLRFDVVLLDLMFFVWCCIRFTFLAFSDFGFCCFFVLGLASLNGLWVIVSVVGELVGCWVLVCCDIVECCFRLLGFVWNL